MIYELANDDVLLPYADSASLCIGRGLLNPDCFHDEYRQHPWFPFEDFSFEQEEVGKRVELIGNGASTFRSEMPCRDRPVRTFAVEKPDRFDVMRLTRWLAYDEGLIWSTSGSLIVNSFSDFVLLALDDETSIALFGQSGADLYRESDTLFVSGYRTDPILADFMSRVRKTWRAETGDSL